jgi:hypothetical protein
MEKDGIKYRMITAYHLQSNGRIKRANKEVKIYLRKYIQHDISDWPDHLAQAEYSYNTRTRENNSFLPYQTVFGETPEVTAKRLIQRVTREEDAARNN